LGKKWSSGERDGGRKESTNLVDQNALEKGLLSKNRRPGRRKRGTCKRADINYRRRKGWKVRDEEEERAS